jgi:hypothetical protein
MQGGQEVCEVCRALRGLMSAGVPAGIQTCGRLAHKFDRSYRKNLLAIACISSEQPV